MKLKVELAYDESTWHSVSARTRLKERGRVRRGGAGSYNITTACTRPEIAWMSCARLDASLNASRRVMPGVRFLLNSLAQKLNQLSCI